MLKTVKKWIPLKLKKKITLILHGGSTYTCPFCNFSSKDLAPLGFDFPVLRDRQVIGANKRFGACFKCSSSDRERLMYAYLAHKYHLMSRDRETRILHIAPEEHLSKLILKLGFRNYICGDLFAEGYEYPAHVQNMNVLDIPFDSNNFDLVICNHVLEHIPDDLRAMKEIARVLKPGGQAILQVPISKTLLSTYEDSSIVSPKDREVFFGQFDHVRIYGQDYAGRLQHAGLTVDKINISKEFEKYGLCVDEDLFIGRK